MSKNNILEYVGDINQLISFQKAILNDGFSKGVEVFNVSNGGNLSATVLPGRCMDIYQVRYKGKNMNYIAPNGITAPEYFDAQGFRWLRSFYVGLLTTCGLQHYGTPRTLPDGEELGLHGRIANTPAENVTYKTDVKGDKITLDVSGTMREARIFGENLTMNRTLSFEYEKDTIKITDTITNHGFTDRQFLYALHLNYGYPLLEEGAKLIIDTEGEVRPRTDEAKRYVSTWDQVEAPSNCPDNDKAPYEERCYFHKVKKDSKGIAQYTLFNEKRGLGVNVKYDGNALPYFCQWKMLGKGEYVLGLEPMNAFLDGPKIGEEGCEAQILAPQQSIDIVTEINFIDKL